MGGLGIKEVDERRGCRCAEKAHFVPLAVFLAKIPGTRIDFPL
jgi:hypothetical protein